MKKSVQQFRDLTLSDRRKFLKWASVTGAVLGLDRLGVLNMLSGSAGVAAADALNLHMRRFVGIVAGNGGFAHFTQIWPHNAVATGTDPNYSWYGMGQQIPAKTNKTMYLAPESPFQSAGPNWQMSAFMAGSNETHTAVPITAASLASGVGMFAGVAAAQRARLSTLIPVIANTRMAGAYGTADNSPQLASVGGSDGVVSLMTSSASQTLLASSASADLFEATVKGFQALGASKRCATDLNGLRTGQVAANVLGKNLAPQLTMPNEALAAYGVLGANGTLVALAKDLWMSLRLFQYDLSGMYLTNAFNDDPHGKFAAGDAAAQSHAKVLGQIFDAWRNDAASIPDPSAPGLSLADNIVFTVSGDTPKQPFQRMGWPDGTPNNSNWIYVMGNGYLKTGWHGGFTTDQKIIGWDPATGADVPNQASNVTANAAAAAVHFAVTSGTGDIVGATRGSVSDIRGVTFTNALGKST